MDETRASSRIDMLAKAGTMLLAAVYGSGFVIVTLHQATFGISAFDLLKPKIFAAGFTFVALVILAAVLAFRFFKIGWWRAAGETSAESVRGLKGWEKLSAGLTFLCACEFGGSYVPFLFDRPPYYEMSGKNLLWLTLTALATLVVLAGNLLLKSRKGVSVPTDVIYTLALSTIAVLTAYWIVQSGNASALWFAVWLFGTGSGIAWLHQKIRGSDEVSKIEWERHVPIAFSVISLYAGFVYPHIRSELGGGVPVQITIYFKRPEALFGGQTLDTNLLEENEHGYYVTPAASEKRAFFIPRDGVSFVKFERPDRH